MSCDKTQRIRGLSFKQEYRNLTSINRTKRSPSMLKTPGDALIPSQDPADAGKITVVLDLDETLIYARKGPLYVRPGIDELLQFLKDNCETIVWTAGIRAYAQAVVRNIDKINAIKHTIYRHSKWFVNAAGYNKDLRLLGRNMDNVILIENTPDCIRGNEQNGIIVADYEGGEYPDNTLPAIQMLLQNHIEIRQKTNISVPQYIYGSKLLSKEYVLSDAGDDMICYCLEPNNMELFREQKAKRVNMDLKK